MSAVLAQERARPAPPAGPLLVVLPNWVGDTVMALPALRALRAALDRDRSATAGTNRTRLVALGRAGFAELLAGCDVLDGSATHGLRGLGGPWRAARAARDQAPEGRFADVLLLPNSFRSGLTARLVPARRRIGFATDGRRILLTDAIAPPARTMPVPAVDWYAELVERAFGLTVADRRPRLCPTAEQRDAASKLLADLPADRGSGESRSYALLHPGASKDDKRWPAERFAAVGRALRERGLAIVVNGGPGERALAATVAAGCGAVDLAARGVTLGSLLGVMAGAALVVANDTGPRHVALGVGTPTVSLFGPTDPRWTTIPGVLERRLLAEPFLPEGEMADRRPKACRIERIEVGDVLAAADQLLTAPR